MNRLANAPTMARVEEKRFGFPMKRFGFCGFFSKRRAAPVMLKGSPQSRSHTPSSGDLHTGKILPLLCCRRNGGNRRKPFLRGSKHSQNGVRLKLQPPYRSLPSSRPGPCLRASAGRLKKPLM